MIELDDTSGVRLDLDGRLIVLALKNLERELAYTNEDVKKRLNSGVEELDYVFTSLARYLGLACGPTERASAEALERKYFERLGREYDAVASNPQQPIEDPHNPNPEWFPCWPESSAERLLSCLETDNKESVKADLDIEQLQQHAFEELDALGDENELPTAPILRSRLMRGRLLIDAVSSLSEKEVSEYAGILRQASDQRP